MDVSFHAGRCCSTQACSAILGLFLPGISLVPKFHVTSPMYAFSQSPHGILYTTPALLRSGSTSFILVSCRQNVEMVVKTVLMSYVLQILLGSLLIPDTYGRHIYCVFGLLFRWFLSPWCCCCLDDVVWVPIHFQDFS